ncbi:MAG TPA: EamA family transporter [Reyranella sp.]|nr:EamA family transporter [Reyranella sp.]
MASVHLAGDDGRMIDLRASDRTVLAALAVLVGQVSNGVGAAWAKSLFPVMGPEGVVALRIGFSAVLLGVVMGVWRLRLPREHWGNLAGYGICLGVMNSVAYQAFSRIPIGIGMAIEVTGPLTLVILGSRRASDFLWLAGTVAGLALVLYPSAGIPPLSMVGIGFACCSATCWAGYIVFGTRLARVGSGKVVAAGALLASTFVLPLGAVASGKAMFNPESLALGLGVAILTSALPYFLQMLAMRQLPRTLYGVIAGGVPAVGAAMSYIVLGEQLAVRQWLGICGVVVAAAGCTLGAAKAKAA